MSLTKEKKTRNYKKICR